MNLPCPFCGSAVYLKEEWFDNGGWKKWVVCEGNCQIEGDPETWNTRHDHRKPKDCKRFSGCNQEIYDVDGKAFLACPCAAFEKESEKK